MPDHGEAMKALVKAFNDGAVYCGMYHELGSDRAECVDCMGPAIAAVLLAADTAEPVGPWEVMLGAGCWIVYYAAENGARPHLAFDDEPTARAVANALNRVGAR